MKTIAITVVSAFTFALVGCAAQADDDQAPAEQQQKEENVETNKESLISTSSSGGWSQSCLTCQNACYADYPRGGGPLQTCLQLCNLSGACKSSFSSVGLVAY